MTNITELMVGDNVRHCGDTYKVTSLRINDVYVFIGLDGTVERFKRSKYFKVV